MVMMKNKLLRISALGMVAAGLVLFFLNRHHAEPGVLIRVHQDVPTKRTRRPATPHALKSGDSVWDEKIRSGLDREDAAGVNRTHMEWAARNPEAALDYFIRVFCQPDLNEAQRNSKADLYLMIKKMTELTGGLDQGKCSKLMGMTGDPGVRSAIVWGLAARLVRDGNVEVAKSFFGGLDKETKDVSGNNFFAVLARSDPGDAARFLEAMNLRGESLGALVQVWAQSDWSSALKWMRGYLGTGTDPQAAARIATSVAGLDAPEVERFLKMVRSEEMESVKAVIAETRLGANFKEGADWVLANLGQAGIDKYLGKALLRNLGDADLALEMAGKLTGPAKGRVQFAIGKSQAERSTPELALKWLEGIGPVSANMDIYNGIMSSWAATDPTAAFKYINTVDSYELQDSLILGMTASVAKSGKMTEEMIRWIAEKKLQGASLDTAASLVGMESPSSAARFISVSPGVSDNVVRDVASRMAGESPQAAAEWASSLPGDVRSAAVTDAVAVWASEDAEAAYQWITTKLDQTLLDAVLHTAVANIGGASVETRKRYLALIPDWKKREQAARLLKL